MQTEAWMMCATKSASFRPWHNEVSMAKRIDKSKMKCNTPKRTPKHPTKSHVVKACESGKEKVIRFGQQGVSGSPPRKGESKADAARRASFKARHAKNIAKGKMSAAYWADREKW